MNRRQYLLTCLVSSFSIIALIFILSFAGCTEGGGGGEFNAGTYPAYRYLDGIVLLEFMDHYDIGSDRVVFFFNRDIKASSRFDINDIDNYMYMCYETQGGSTCPSGYISTIFDQALWTETYPSTLACGTTTPNCDTLTLKVKTNVDFTNGTEYRLVLHSLVDGDSVIQQEPENMFFIASDNSVNPYVTMSYPVYNQGYGSTTPEPFPPHEIIQMQFSEAISTLVVVLDDTASFLDELEQGPSDLYAVNENWAAFDAKTDLTALLLTPSGLEVNTEYTMFLAAEPLITDGNVVYRPSNIGSSWFSAISCPPTQDSSGARLVKTEHETVSEKYDNLYGATYSIPSNPATDQYAIDSFTFRFKTSRIKIDNISGGFYLQVKSEDFPLDFFLPEVSGVLYQGTAPAISAVNIKTPGASGVVDTPATIPGDTNSTLDYFYASYVPIHFATGNTIYRLKAQPTCPSCGSNPPGMDLITYIVETTANPEYDIDITYPLSGSTAFNVARVAGAVTPAPNSVQLYVNGAFFNEVSDGSTFEFNSVAFNQGSNKILIMAVGDVITVKKMSVNFDNIGPYVVDSYPINCYAYYISNGNTTSGLPAGCNNNKYDVINSNDSLVLTFSESINPDGIPSLSQGDTYAVFVIKTAGSNQGVKNSYLSLSPDGRTVVINPGSTLPSDPLPNYRLRAPRKNIPPDGEISNMVVDLAGNAIDAWPNIPYNIFSPSFIVSSTSNSGDPTVTDINPPNGSSVPNTNSISITFNEPVNPIDIYNCLELVYSGSTTSVAITITPVKDTGYTQYLIEPTEILDADTHYQIKLDCAIGDLAGNTKSAQVLSGFTTLPTGDYDIPIVNYITLNNIDTLFNCKNDLDEADDGLYCWPDAVDGCSTTNISSCHLAVPPTAFSIDIDYTDKDSGVDPDSLSVIAQSGTTSIDISSRFTASSTHATWLVDEDIFMKDQLTTLTVTVIDGDSPPNVSDGATYVFKVLTVDDGMLPFETRQIVYLDFLRDIWKIDYHMNGQTITGLDYHWCPQPCYSFTTDAIKDCNPAYCDVDGGDTLHRPDFNEELYLYGLNSSAGDGLTVSNTGGKTVNQVVTELIQIKIKQRLTSLFGIWVNDQGEEVYRDDNSINIEFEILNDEDQRVTLLPYYPPSPDLPPEGGVWSDAPTLYDDTTHPFSTICFGGKHAGRDFDNANSTNQFSSILKEGATGQSQVDDQNDHQNNLCGIFRYTPLDGNTNPSGCAGPPNGQGFMPAPLGSYPASILIYVSIFINSSYSNSLFHQMFDPFLPSNTGSVAIGDTLVDSIVLSLDFDRTQYGNTSPEAIRYDRIMKAVEAYGMSSATLAAHELGHAIGLSNINSIATPFPPDSSFGGNMKISGKIFSIFPCSASTAADCVGQGHISLQNFKRFGFFPGSAMNIMDADWIAKPDAAMNYNTGFTSYDWAYMLGKTIYTVDNEDIWMYEMGKIDYQYANCIDDIWQ